jgi:hypothetical protein
MSRLFLQYGVTYSSRLIHSASTTAIVAANNKADTAVLAVLIALSCQAGDSFQIVH